MNTLDIFKSQPMSNYDENSKPTGQMNNIQTVSLASLQERVAPRHIATGNNRGEMTVKGLIRVVDTDSSVRLIMGFKKGAF
jgi:hypothetical protein